MKRKKKKAPVRIDLFPLTYFEGKVVSVHSTDNRIHKGVLMIKDGLCIVQDRENQPHVFRKDQILLIREDRCAGSEA